jgi:hypothetical protein
MYIYSYIVLSLISFYLLTVALSILLQLKTNKKLKNVQTLTDFIDNIDELDLLFTFVPFFNTIALFTFFILFCFVNLIGYSKKIIKNKK